MANMKNFSDYTGEPVELRSLTMISNKAFQETFAGVKGRRCDSYTMWVGHDSNGVMLPVTRMITYKSQPSLHECNAKCMNGKCNGTCECRCGGKNHGRNNR